MEGLMLMMMMQCIVKIMHFYYTIEHLRRGLVFLYLHIIIIEIENGFDFNLYINDLNCEIRNYNYLAIMITR